MDICIELFNRSLSRIRNLEVRKIKYTILEIEELSKYETQLFMNVLSKLNDQRFLPLFEDDIIKITEETFDEKIEIKKDSSSTGLMIDEEKSKQAEQNPKSI
jgi:hypothetical protein